MFKAMLKTLLYIVLTGVVLIAAIVFVIPSFISDSEVKKYVTQQVKEHTGKDIEIKGSANISLFPAIRLRFNDATLIDPTTKSTLNVATLDVAMNTLKLFQRNAELSLYTVINGTTVELDAAMNNIDAFRVGGDTRVDMVMSQPIEAVIATELNVAPAMLTIPSIKVTSSALRMSGQAQLVQQEKPTITAELDVDSVNIRKVDEMLAPLLVLGHAIAPRPDTANELADPAKNKDAIWSKEPIDLSVLKTINADVTITMDGVRYDAVALGRTKLNATIKDGTLEARLAESALFDGTVSTRIKMDSAKSPPPHSIELLMKDVTVGNALEALTGKRSAEGKGTFELSSITNGNNLYEMVSRLEGHGRIALNDGVIKGINLSSLSALSPQKVGLGLFNEEGASELDKFTTNFVITQGVVQNNDLFVNGPLTQFKGKGKFYLLDMTMKYTLIPVVGVEGFGLQVPVKIEGPASNPTVTPDLSGIVKENVSQVLDKVLSDDKKEELNKVKNKLDKILGEGNPLSKFLPTKKTPAPANDNTPPAEQPAAKSPPSQPAQ